MDLRVRHAWILFPHLSFFFFVNRSFVIYRPFSEWFSFLTLILNTTFFALSFAWSLVLDVTFLSLTFTLLVFISSAFALSLAFTPVFPAAALSFTSALLLLSTSSFLTSSLLLLAHATASISLSACFGRFLRIFTFRFLSGCSVLFSFVGSVLSRVI